MDPDFAIGMLKTITTFLYFSGKQNFSKDSFKIYNLKIFFKNISKISNLNQIQTHIWGSISNLVQIWFELSFWNSNRNAVVLKKNIT